MNTDLARVSRLDNYGDFTSPENDHGIHIDVSVKGNVGFSEVVIPAHMSGWKGPDATYAHKGAVATTIETVMAFSGIHFLKRATNAKSLLVEYFTQVPIKTKLRAEARLVQKRGENEAILECVLSDEHGTVLARGTGTYALYSTDQLRNLAHAQFPELVLGPNQANTVAACRPADLTRFEDTLKTM
jgi:acyl-coenzyme A thioesterase PaaI-like protein